jgi:hypothetical protein
MFVEPGIVDANVLVYAMDADAPQHAASRALLEAGRDPSTTLVYAMRADEKPRRSEYFSDSRFAQKEVRKDEQEHL